MHSKFQKRGLHRRAAEVERRQVGQNSPNDVLTGPVTLTLTVIHGPEDTPIATLSDSDSDDDDLPTPLPPPPPATSVPPQPLAITTTNLPPAVTTSSLESVPPTISITTSPVLPASTSSSTTTSPSGRGTSSADNSDENGTSAVQLSSGAIAGIVIGCLVVLLAAAVFGLRKRNAKNRIRLRGMWIGSKSLKLGRNGNGSGDPAGLEPTPYTYQPPGGADLPNGSGSQRAAGRMSFVGGQPATTFAAVPPGPLSVNTNLRGPASPRSMSTLGLGLPQALPSAYGYGAEYGIGSAGPMSTPVSRKFTAVVARSFVPSLPDELSISVGESIVILQEFDDGWAECMNRSGEIGMVPLECFDSPRGGLGGRMVANSPVENAMKSSREDGARNSRRYTSLPSARRWDVWI